MIDRRTFVGGAAGVAAAALAAPAIAQGRLKVVVIGGGPGGATAAKYLVRDEAKVDVTLVEANRTYVTPFTSNLFLGGLKPYRAGSNSATTGWPAAASGWCSTAWSASTATPGACAPRAARRCPTTGW